MRPTRKTPPAAAVKTAKTRKSIPPKVALEVWLRAAGRCQFRACNKPLWRDELTMEKMNAAYLAHIVAAEPDGPRGDVTRSPLLAVDPENLMLMCDPHHRRIDAKRTRHLFPEHLLLEFRKQHEERIERVTGISPSLKAEAVVVDLSIGQRAFSSSAREAHEALTAAGYYPSASTPERIRFTELRGRALDQAYWNKAVEHVKQRAAAFIEQRLLNSKDERLALFALGPIPLLVLLGRVFGDIQRVLVFQKQREPEPDWNWRSKRPARVKITRSRTLGADDIVALRLCFSDDVRVSTLEATFPQRPTIYSLGIEQPRPDFLRTRQQLAEFRDAYRLLIKEIKANHPRAREIHCFPAVPNAVAIEMGRCLLPKSDLTLRLYEYDRGTDKFISVLDSVLDA